MASREDRILTNLPPPLPSPDQLDAVDAVNPPPPPPVIVCPRDLLDHNDLVVVAAAAGDHRDTERPDAAGRAESGKFSVTTETSDAAAVVKTAEVASTEKDREDATDAMKSEGSGDVDSGYSNVCASSAETGEAKDAVAEAVRAALASPAETGEAEDAVAAAVRAASASPAETREAEDAVAAAVRAASASPAETGEAEGVVVAAAVRAASASSAETGKAEDAVATPMKTASASPAETGKAEDVVVAAVRAASASPAETGEVEDAEAAAVGVASASPAETDEAEDAVAAPIRTASSEFQSKERDSGDAELRQEAAVQAAATYTARDSWEPTASPEGQQSSPAESASKCSEGVTEQLVIWLPSPGKAGFELGQQEVKAVVKEEQEHEEKGKQESLERQDRCASKGQQELGQIGKADTHWKEKMKTHEKLQSASVDEPELEQTPAEVEDAVVKPNQETAARAVPRKHLYSPASRSAYIDRTVASDVATTRSPAAAALSTSALGLADSAAAVLNGEGHYRKKPDLRAAPTRSSLKRKHSAVTGDSVPKRSRRSIQFAGVTVFYFPRAQGFTCIPSQGGSTLGMADAHSHVQRFTLTDHVNEQRLAHRQLLTRLRVKQRKLQRLAPLPTSVSSSEESDAGSEEGSDLSDSELDVDSYFFLRPVSTRQRRALLRASGVRKIEPMEKDECRDIRTSREFCGCACKVVCRPDNCQCAGAGIKCQVDRQNFPCGCTRDGCQNPSGRIEFNPSRVRSHFVETIMREQPPVPAAGLSSQDLGGAGGSGGSWVSCGWQKTAGCAASPDHQYMAEQELSGAGYGFTELSAPYQEDSSYSENSDGSSDGSYEAAGAAAAVANATAPGCQTPQTQSHYSSFSFEGGLQNYGAPPYPAAIVSGYPQPYVVCQSYAAGSHYPASAPLYSYSFNKYPTSGPGPGGGSSPVASAAPPAAGYPPSCGYPTYPTAAGCPLEPPAPVYATNEAYGPADCSYPAAAPTDSFASRQAAGAFPPLPVDSGVTTNEERHYTDLHSVLRPAGAQLESLADLLQDKFGGWAASGGGGAASSTHDSAVTAAHCGTPPSEDSGVDVDDCAAKHAPPADENIGQIMKKTMVETVSA